MTSTDSPEWFFQPSRGGYLRITKFRFSRSWNQTEYSLTCFSAGKYRTASDRTNTSRACALSKAFRLKRKAGTVHAVSLLNTIACRVDCIAASGSGRTEGPLTLLKPWCTVTHMVTAAPRVGPHLPSPLHPRTPATAGGCRWPSWHWCPRESRLLHHTGYLILTHTF